MGTLLPVLALLAALAPCRAAGVTLNARLARQQTAPPVLPPLTLTLSPAAGVFAPSSTPLMLSPSLSVVPNAALFSAAAGLTPSAAAPAGSYDAPVAALEQGSDLSERFDAAFTNRLRAGWDIEFDGAEASRYRTVLEESRQAGWESLDGAPGETKALVETAGILTAPVSFEHGAKVHQGLTVLPAQGASRLNTLASEFKARLGVSLDYLPGFIGDSAAFLSAQKRILLPHFGRVDFYPALLHEARHAHYSRALARGESRLFHFSALAWPGWSLDSDSSAGSYSKYLSFEELSTFPKTLRHMLSAAEQADSPEAGRILLEMAVNRGRHYEAILRTADGILSAARARSSAGSLDASVLTEKEASDLGFDKIPGGRWLKLRIARGTAFLPIATQDRRNALARYFSDDIDRLAWKAVDLKMARLSELVRRCAPLAEAYTAALAADDLVAAKKAANALTALTARADAAWLAESAALR